MFLRNKKMFLTHIIMFLTNKIVFLRAQEIIEDNRIY